MIKLNIIFVPLFFLPSKIYKVLLDYDNFCTYCNAFETLFK